MAKLFDNVGQTTATTGTGTITLASTAISDSTNGDYQTFTGAGAVAGDVVNYRIVTGGNKWENGTGTLGGTGPGFTLTRTVIQSWDGATLGTTALTLAGTSNVYCVPFGRRGNDFVIDTADDFTITSGNSKLTVSNTNGSKLTYFGTNGWFVGSNVTANGPGGQLIHMSSAGNFSINVPLTWGSPSSAPDVYLLRDAAQTLAQRNGTNSQTFRLYGTYTGSADAWAEFNHSTSGNLTISTKQNGTGAAGSLALDGSTVVIKISGVTYGTFSTNGYNGDVTGAFVVGATNLRVGTGSTFQVTSSGATTSSAGYFGFSSTTSNATSGPDTAIMRNTAGVVEINNGTAGTFRDLIARNVRTNPTTVASLTAASTAGAGARSFVTDATVTTFATTVAGGGSNAVPVYSDGTNWKIG